ncbi:MAG: DUF4328 domain-containing protein [Sporichthyaceae bacterium]
MSDPYPADDFRRAGPPISVLAGLAVAGLALAGAASVWTAVAFAQRDVGDLRRYAGRQFVGTPKERDIELAEYTGAFVRQAALPLGVAIVVCAVVFLMWLSAADRAARDWAGGLDTDRGRALGAWFVPVANLVIPLRSLRELAVAHRAWTAEKAVWAWWIPWVLSTLIGVFFLNAAFAWAPFYTGPTDPTPEDLAGLDGYGVFVGGGLAVAALAMIVVVVNLTTAVRGRYGDVNDEG